MIKGGFEMNGQWIGAYTGANSGTAIINVDDMGDHFEGIAYMINSSSLLPTIFANLKTNDKNKNFTLDKLPIFPVNPATNTPDAWDNIKKYYPDNVFVSKYVDVDVMYDDEVLSLNWKTEHGLESACTLSKNKTDKPSEYAPEPINNWSEYKQFVAQMEQRKFIFRGQSDRWRLRTKFHRTGRANVERFINEDRQNLYRHLSANTKHIFNLKDPDENGAFFNLVQHHGYPTPLLDWTYSPYVAAFFAYRGIANSRALKAEDSEKVRIFVFDKDSWRKDYQQSLSLVTPHLHLSIMEFIAINNERMIPQQAISTVTNVDDIEAYINIRETKEKKYLRVIDLPLKDRKIVMHELSYMGITAGSLFPGLDGACEELRERFFDI